MTTGSAVSTAASARCDLAAYEVGKERALRVREVRSHATTPGRIANGQPGRAAKYVCPHQVVAGVELRGLVEAQQTLGVNVPRYRREGGEMLLIVPALQFFVPARRRAGSNDVVTRRRFAPRSPGHALDSLQPNHLNRAECEPLQPTRRIAKAPVVSTPHIADQPVAIPFTMRRHRVGPRGAPEFDQGGDEAVQRGTGLELVDDAVTRPQFSGHPGRSGSGTPCCRQRWWW